MFAKVRFFIFLLQIAQQAVQGYKIFDLGCLQLEDTSLGALDATTFEFGSQGLDCSHFCLNKDRPDEAVQITVLALWQEPRCVCASIEKAEHSFRNVSRSFCTSGENGGQHKKHGKNVKLKYYAASCIETETWQSADTCATIQFSNTKPDNWLNPPDLIFEDTTIDPTTVTGPVFTTELQTETSPTAIPTTVEPTSGFTETELTTVAETETTTTMVPTTNPVTELTTAEAGTASTTEQTTEVSTLTPGPTEVSTDHETEIPSTTEERQSTTAPSSTFVTDEPSTTEKDGPSTTEGLTTVETELSSTTEMGTSSATEASSTPDHTEPSTTDGSKTDPPTTTEDSGQSTTDEPATDLPSTTVEAGSSTTGRAETDETPTTTESGETDATTTAATSTTDQPTTAETTTEDGEQSTTDTPTGETQPDTTTDKNDFSTTDMSSTGQPEPSTTTEESGHSTTVETGPSTTTDNEPSTTGSDRTTEEEGASTTLEPEHSSTTEEESPTTKVPTTGETDLPSTTEYEPSTTDSSTPEEEPSTTRIPTTGGTDQPSTTDEYDPSTTEVPTTTESRPSTSDETETPLPTTTEEPSTTEVPTTGETDGPTTTEEGRSSTTADTSVPTTTDKAESPTTESPTTPGTMPPTTTDDDDGSTTTGPTTYQTEPPTTTESGHSSTTDEYETGPTTTEAERTTADELPSTTASETESPNTTEMPSTGTDVASTTESEPPTTTEVIPSTGTEFTTTEGETNPPSTTQLATTEEPSTVTPEISTTPVDESSTPTEESTSTPTSTTEAGTSPVTQHSTSEGPTGSTEPPTTPGVPTTESGAPPTTDDDVPTTEAPTSTTEFVNTTTTTTTEVPTPPPSTTEYPSSDPPSTTEFDNTTTTTTTTTTTEPPTSTDPVTPPATTPEPSTTTEADCLITCIETDRFGNEWRACSDTTVRMLCPRPQASDGTAQWYCTPDGNFNGSVPDYSGCRNIWLGIIEDILDAVDSLPEDDVEQLIEDIKGYIRGSMDPNNNDTIYFGHEMKNIFAVGEKILELLEDTPQFETFTGRILEIFGDILTFSDPWEELSPHGVADTGSSFVSGCENSALTLARRNMATRISKRVKIDPQAIHYQNTFADRPEFRVMSGLSTNPSTEDPPLTYPESYGSKDSRIEIPNEWIQFYPQGVPFAGMDLNSEYVNKIFPPYMNALNENLAENENQIINGPLMSFALNEQSTSPATRLNFTDGGVRIVFRHDVYAYGSEINSVRRKLHDGERRKAVRDTATCVYWNPTDLFWSSEGCHLVSSGRDESICECSHLTSFAIIMDLHDYIGKNLGLEVLTFILLPLSVVCLVLCIIVFTLNHLKDQVLVSHPRNDLVIHLCSTLLVANLLLLITVDRNYLNLSDSACTAFAIILHYVFLCAFAWMAIEGVLLTKLVFIDIFGSGLDYVKTETIGAYLVPAVIVAITCAVNFSKDHHGYGNDSYCWLTGNYLWSFAGPAALVVVFNSVVLISSVRRSYRLYNNPKVTVQRTAKSASFWIRGSLSLTVLMGLTWIFGFLMFINNSTLANVAAYIFIIFNASQGIFIFVCYVLLNEKVRGHLGICGGRSPTGSNQENSGLSSNLTFGSKVQRTTKRIKEWFSRQESTVSAEVAGEPTSDSRRTIRLTSTSSNSHSDA